MRFTRVFLIILDSLGVGAMDDAASYGDEGTNTLGNMATAVEGLHIPVLEKMGIGNIIDIEGVSRVNHSAAYYTKAKEASAGKDTMTGHWEIMGIRTDKPFKTFTDSGFPKDLISQLEKETGKKFIGNIAASGTQIINDLGSRHITTGELILYTSADSVLQIAAHESVVPLQELYKICRIAREITMRDEWKVGRIIARPFTGEKGNYTRTPNRHDYALKPPRETVLNSLKGKEYDVIAIGKINDIYAGEGITKAFPSKSNDQGMEIISSVAQSRFEGLAYLNLVDFDMIYGHRRDCLGYAKALEAFDEQLGYFIRKLDQNDLLMITADHGNDPTHKGSDHTREYVPILAYANCLKGMGELEPLDTFSDIGATIADNFSLPKPEHGNSFLRKLV